jgi:hypothetical protein
MFSGSGMPAKNLTRDALRTDASLATHPGGKFIAPLQFCKWLKGQILAGLGRSNAPPTAVGCPRSGSEACPMRRREFIVGLGSGAAAWPIAARAQQPAKPVMGYLTLGRIPDSPGNPFLEGLAKFGYVPGRNLAIEFRGADFQNSILPQLAADLVARKVAVIVTQGSPCRSCGEGRNLDDPRRLHA